MLDATRRRLREVRRGLLHLHRVLLDVERAAYEHAHGRIASRGELLKLVIYHEHFAWLHALSELVVQIDEVLDTNEVATERDADTLMQRARALLTPTEAGNGFGKRYYDALQRDPGVVLAHAEVSKLLATGS